MIITETPLRISFFGGGTDMERFWSEEDGCVLSCTINKYIYVIVRKSFDNLIHIKYFHDEDVAHINEIKHDIVRECMRKVGIEGGIEVAILSDIPHTGSGLGSSSSLTVGLLNAFYTYTGKAVCAEALGRQACEIEIDILGKPIGKQDQYIAAYGGLRMIRFKPGGIVEVQPVEPGYDVYSELRRNFLLFYTGTGRKAESILKEQNKMIQNTRPILRKMKEQVLTSLDIIQRRDIGRFGFLMKEGWLMKKQLASEISNDRINELMDKALSAGASGAKITGAGGGGFLLVFCKPEYQNSVRSNLSGLKEFSFDFEKEGTKLLLYK